MDREQIIKKYFPDAKDVKRHDFERFLKHFETILDDRDPKEALLDKGFRCQLYFLAHNNVSLRHYYKMNKYVSCLLDFYGISASAAPLPTSDELFQAKQSTGWFSDIDDFLDFAETVVKRACVSVGVDYDPTLDGLDVMAIGILAWHDVRLGKMLQFERSSIRSSLVNGRPVYEIEPKENEWEEISEREYICLVRLSEATQGRAIGSSRVYQYKGEENVLLRGMRGSGVQDPRRCIYIFNQAIPQTVNRTLSYFALNASALFKKIHDDKSDLPLLRKIEKYTDCSINTRTSYKRMYGWWLETFYPEEA